MGGRAARASSPASDRDAGREIGEARSLLGIIAHVRGHWKELLHAEFVSSLGRSPEVASSVFDPHLCLAEFCLCSPTGYEEIIGYAHEVLAVATKAGSIQGRAFAELLVGEANLFSDRIVAAEEHLTAALALHEQASAPSGQLLALQRLAELFLARGQRWQARRLVRRGLRLAAGQALEPHFLVRLNGTLIEAAPDAATAAAWVIRADADLAGRSVCLPCSMGFRVAAPMALARAGLVGEARRRLDETERIAGMWPGGPWHAALWEARGVLRQAEGDRRQAAALFKEAAERFARAGRPRDEARCRAEAGD